MGTDTARRSSRRRHSTPARTSLAVAIVDEGIELRAAGVTVPILLLAEIPAETIADAPHSRPLTLTVGSLEGARNAIKAAEEPSGAATECTSRSTPECTGWAWRPRTSSTSLTYFPVRRPSMSRVSLRTSAWPTVQATRRPRLHALPDRVLQPGARRSLAERGAVPRVVHAANSAGALGYPEARYSMVRFGLSLYGYVPGEWLVSALGEFGEHWSRRSRCAPAWLRCDGSKRARVRATDGVACSIATPRS